MDTPIYPPAAAFEAPVAAPYELKVRNLPVAEIMADPAIMAVVVKHMPAIKMMTGAGLVQSQLGNMTLLDFAVFGGLVNNPAFAAIDRDLAQIAATRGAK